MPTPTKMTRQEALAEAKRRWGLSGFVHKVTRKRVYEVCGGWDLEYYGSGPSWEAAFKDAERRDVCESP